jgi:hypothetical protein
MKKIISVCAALTLLLSGCQTLSLKERQNLFTTENGAYVGKTHDDLIKGKGVPSGTANLTNSGKVVEYYTAQVEISGGGYYGYPAARFIGNANGGGSWIYPEHMRSFPIQSWTFVCKIDFVVTPQNIVESWKYEGNGCF